MRSIIFISHRSTDADVADIIKDFLVATGIPNEKVFCSSLPGNDVKEKIGPEVKQHLQAAIINILILSKDYYNSAYCLNEAGVAWYLDDAVVIPVGLPEIDPTKMIGFLNSDYKLRRLDNNDDVSYIYDIAREKTDSATIKAGVLTRELNKLNKRYLSFIDGRESNEEPESDEQPVKVQLSSDASLLLIYGATDLNGEIEIIRNLVDSHISTAGFDFMKDKSAEESARWEGALEELVQKGLVKAMNSKPDVFKLTREGFGVAKQLNKKNPHVDTKIDPKIYMKSDQDYETDNIFLLSEVVLLFAAELDGTIEVDKSAYGATYVVGKKYNMNASQDAREIAKWDAVIEMLIDKHYIEKEKKKGSTITYRVKYEGYNSSSSFKELNHIDTSDKTPQDIIRTMEE